MVFQSLGLVTAQQLIGSSHWLMYGSCFLSLYYV